MIVISPDTVVFAGSALAGVGWVLVNRAAARVVREWSDEGPHVRLIDVTEQLVTVQVLQEIALGDLSAVGGTGGLQVGASGTLRVSSAINASDQGRRTLTATAVLVGVTHRVGSGMRGRATRTLTFEVVASNGATDPVTVA